MPSSQPCWIGLVFGYHIFHWSPPAPHDKLSLHPLQALSHLLPSSSPPSTPRWQPGQGRWPNLSLTAPLPRGNTTDTNYHTAGARPGNRMATTWSNQGTQQQGPKKAKKSEWVCAHLSIRQPFIGHQKYKINESHIFQYVLFVYTVMSLNLLFYCSTN